VTSNVNSEWGRVGSLLQFLLMERRSNSGLFMHQISNMTLHDSVKIPQEITLMLAIGAAHNWFFEHVLESCRHNSTILSG
jgi:hypothetical protein